MKTFTFLAAIAVVLTVFNSCKKEETILKKGLPDSVSQKYESEFGKFKEEIIVYDASGENSLFVALHSDYKESIADYLKYFKLELVPKTKEDLIRLKSARINSEPTKNSDFQVPSIVLERKVTVEVLAENIKDKNEAFALSVTKVKSENVNVLKSGSFIPGTYVDFTTYGDFLGVWHTGYGWMGDDYDLYAYFNVKYGWLGSWHQIGEALLIGDDPNRYFGYIDDQYDDFYRLAIGVYYDYRQTANNLKYAYDKEGFRGHDCSVGSYDTSNCYVGTAPEGTTAWFGDGHFYYTPLNGNECPLPGSSFDTVNCYVGDYPSDCLPFTFGNSWYVQPDRILN